MKKVTSKKLSLSKIRIASLSSTKQAGIQGGGKSAACVSFPISCLSQGAPICSEDSCRF